MERGIQQRKLAVELLAGENSQYQMMLQENAELERKFNAVLSELSTEQMDIICDFLTHCEAMSGRLLELACTYMRFPEWKIPKAVALGRRVEIQHVFPSCCRGEHCSSETHDYVHNPGISPEYQGNTLYFSQT